MSSDLNPADLFREEARDLLGEFEEALIGLEAEPGRQDLVDAAFRALHTIKGSGAMFEFTELSGFAHDLESAFVVFRDARIPIGQEAIDLGLRGKDLLGEFIGRLGTTPDEAQQAALTERAQAVVRELQTLVGTEADAGGSSPEAERVLIGDGRSTASVRRSLRISFRPSRNTFKNGTNPLGLLQELADLGELMTVGYSEDIPSLDEITPDLCYLRWDVLITTEADDQEITDVFMFIDGESTLEILPVASGEYRRLGDILVDRGSLSEEKLETLMARRPPLGEMLVQEGVVSEAELRSALEEQRLLAESSEEVRAGRGDTAFIKVPTSRLDRLVNLVGEFVSLQGQLSLSADRLHDRELMSHTEQFERLVRESRELSMEMHMVPVDTLFAPFRRMVRDVARELGKRVQLTIEGTETELDKNMVESLRDPLMHIIRNAIDHGIESEERRREADKPPRGSLHLSASYSGAFVVIRVDDDGGGLDAARIRRRAIERGLIDPEVELGREQIYELLFEPGFSTAEKASRISGRGVGMDVVRRNVEHLNGFVQVSSEEGMGTTVEIRIPLTLAIVEGLLTEIGDAFYLINIAYIRECLDRVPEATQGGRGIIDYRGTVVPLLDLAEVFGVGRSPADAPVLVVIAGDTTVALRLTRIHGNYQSVVKPLGPMFDGVEGISGAVFLPDGTPALMLDIERLVRRTVRSGYRRGGST